MRAPRITSLFSAVAMVVMLNGVAVGQTTTSSPAPSATERAITLSSPAVVFIDTSVVLKAALTYRNPTAISGLAQIRQTYRFDYATGSGFTVAPDGTVVTASHVVEPPQQDMLNYAANRMVLEGFGYTYPQKDSSPFGRYYLPVSWENTLLQQSYRGVAMKVDAKPVITVFSAVDVAQQQLPNGEPANVLLSTGFDKTDVAILKINATNMPTVALASTASNLASGAEVTALGFPGSSRDALKTGVTEPTKIFGHVSTIRHEATGNLIELDAAIQPGMSGGPVIDAQGNVIGLTSFALLQSTGEAGTKYLRTVDDIKAGLSQAGVTPAQGPVDTSLASAMNLFWAHHYSASIPAFQRTIALWNGHPLATEYLASAESLKGTAQDIPVPVPVKASSFPVAPVAGAAVVILIAVAGLFLVRRRRGSAPEPIPAPTTPVGPAATPSPPMVAPERTLVSVGAPPAPVANGRVAAPDASAVPPAPTHHFCVGCGERVEPDEHFCPSCGHALK